MSIRGIRGATTVCENSAEEILNATQELLLAILNKNPSLEATDIASALFTLSPDLNAAYPAKAARKIGWTAVPLMCFQEIPVPGGVNHCVRVLLHWNTELPQNAVSHVYLRKAAALRPDLANQSNKKDASHE